MDENEVFDTENVYGKNDNLRGPNGEPSQKVTTIDKNGNIVEIDDHSNGHYFSDTNEYEQPHFQGPSGEHLSYWDGLSKRCLFYMKIITSL